MAGDSQQLSFHIALYVDQDTINENQIQIVKAIAWSVQEGDVNLKDLVRSLKELTFVDKRFCHTDTASGTDNGTRRQSRVRK